MELITKHTDELILTKYDITVGEVSAYVTTYGNEDLEKDVMARGCLDKWIKGFMNEDKKMLPMLWQHSSNEPIGHWHSFETDDKGVIGHGTLYLETTRGDDIRKMMMRGLIKAVSIGFMAYDYDNKPNGGRKFNEIGLREVSLVLNPANPMANIFDVKNEDGSINIRQLEKLLREAHLSRREAKALISEGSKGLRDVIDIEAEKLALVHKLMGE